VLKLRLGGLWDQCHVFCTSDPNSNSQASRHHNRLLERILSFQKYERTRFLVVQTPPRHILALTVGDKQAIAKGHFTALATQTCPLDGPLARDQT